MAIDVKRVLREKPGSFTSWFLPLMVMAENNVELIDLLELFGLDRLGEAIERLGGSRIVFPTWATVDTLVRDAYLLARLENRANKEGLEEEFEVPFEALVARARALKRALRKLNSPGRVPGKSAALKWLKGVQKTNGEIAFAVEETNKDAAREER